MTKQKQ